VRGELAQAVIEKRRVWFPEDGFVTTPVYDRDRVPAGAAIGGPAIIEQMDTTTVVPPRARVRADRAGYLHMTLETAEIRGRTAWLAA
jgi:N-methylhydantoinase A